MQGFLSKSTKKANNRRIPSRKHNGAWRFVLSTIIFHKRQHLFYHFRRWVPFFSGRWTFSPSQKGKINQSILIWGTAKTTPGSKFNTIRHRSWIIDSFRSKHIIFPYPLRILLILIFHSQCLCRLTPLHEIDSNPMYTTFVTNEKWIVQNEIIILISFGSFLVESGSVFV